MRNVLRIQFAEGYYADVLHADERLAVAAHRELHVFLNDPQSGPVAMVTPTLSIAKTAFVCAEVITEKEAASSRCEQKELM